jgi:hypothetical protein
MPDVMPAWTGLHPRKDMTVIASDPATHSPATNQIARTLRSWLLIGIGTDLILMALRVARYPTFIAMPGALTFLIEPMLFLGVYAAIAVALPGIAARLAYGPSVLRAGTVIGLIGGIIEVVSTALESLMSLPQSLVTLTSGVAMLGLFLSFVVAGFVGGHRTRVFGSGLEAATLSAMVAILVVVTFGFLLINTSLQKLAHDEIGDPDYQRSGWMDARAFAIANTFDAGFTHLWEAPIIATILGAAGSGIGQIRVRRQPKTTN